MSFDVKYNSGSMLDARFSQKKKKISSFAVVLLRRMDEYRVSKIEYLHRTPYGGVSKI